MDMPQNNWWFGNGSDLTAWNGAYGKPNVPGWNESRNNMAQPQPQPLAVSKNGQRKTRLLLFTGIATLIIVFLIGIAVTLWFTLPGSTGATQATLTTTAIQATRTTTTTQAPRPTTTTQAPRPTTTTQAPRPTTTTQAPRITTTTQAPIITTTAQAPEMYLTIDSIRYQAAQEITIDEGSHTFQCTARNVEFGSSLVWDFGDNSVQTPRWTTTTSKGVSGLIDVTSIVTVDSISPGASGSSVACSTTDSGARRKRQILNVSILINLTIQSSPLADTITLQIDASPYVTGTTVTLDEGPHDFECSATNARTDDAAIAWVFGQNNNFSPNLATNSASGGVPQIIRSTINGLQITDEYCDAMVTCYVGSWRNPFALFTGLLSVTVKLRVKTAPTSTTLTPRIDGSRYNSVTRRAEVIEDVIVNFQCQISGTTTGDADVVFTLNRAFGTTSVTTYPDTSTGVLSCSENQFTDTVSVTPKHDQHHAQRLECIASNSAGTTAVSIVYLDVLVPPTIDDMGIRIDGKLYADQSMVVLAEGDHDFQCVTSYSNPASTVTWEFGGIRVAGDAYTLVSSGPASGQLISKTSFIYSRALDDGNCDDIVTCAATNKAVPDGETPPTVSVTLRVNNAPTDVVISVHPDEDEDEWAYDPSTQVMSLTVGIEYTLVCTVNGADEEPDVTWTLTSPSTPMMPLTEVDSAANSGVDCSLSTHTETFVLTPSYAAHNGQVLTCNGSNSDGSASTSITLNILDDWAKNNVIFKVDSAMVADGASIDVFEGVPITIDCSVPDATPSADITLTLLFDDSSTEIIQTSTITRSFTQGALVTCTASNNAGSAQPPIQRTLAFADPAHCGVLLSLFDVTKSGAYYIYPGQGSIETRRMKVWCDMDTTERIGWTVFQRRKDGSVDFYRGWTEYAGGFGDVEGEFWLGNENIYKLTNSAIFGLRVDLHDGTSPDFALYTSFRIDSANDKYRLDLGTYITSSSAEDGLTFSHDSKFSTYEDDNVGGVVNCAEESHGGWWYANDVVCHKSNLNGLYVGTGGVALPHQQRGGASTPCTTEFVVSWEPLEYFSLKTTEMKLRIDNTAVP